MGCESTNLGSGVARGSVDGGAGLLGLGATRDMGEGLGLRARARAGVSLSTLDAYDASARFAADASGQPGFSNAVATSQAVGRIGAGVSLLRGETMEAGLPYEGAFADGDAGHTGGINLTIRF